LRILWLLLLGLQSAVGHAQVFDRLYPDSAQITLAKPLEWVATPKGTVATPDPFNAQPDAWRFKPYTGSTALPTSDQQEVWVRFTLAVTPNRQVWFVRLARASIVKVSFFSHDGSGQWQVQSAGESIAPAQWALRTRSPSFEVQSSSRGEQTYYMRFEHRTAITERPMLISPIEYINGASRVGILIGLLGGMFGLLSVLCLAAFVIARNPVFLWFGAFVMALMFSQATLIGFGGWRMWPNSAYLNQVMGWVTGCLALATGAWFCATASYAKDSHIWIYRLLRALALGSLLWAVLAVANLEVFSREIRNAWTALVTVLVIGSLAWMTLRGQRWNALLLIGLLPIGLATLTRLAYNLGWVVQVEFAQTAGIFSAILGLLWLMLALVWRSRIALLSTELAAAMNNYDAATGLVQERVVRARLPHMLLRATQLKMDCGVIKLRWVNYAQLMASVGPEKQKAMLRQVGQVLSRVTRDIDTAARLGDGHFMILVEGPISRIALTSMSTQILSAFIRASDKFGLPSAFSFHIAIWQADVVPCTDKEVLEALTTRLNQMSYGTKRPVQFVDMATSDPGPEQREELNQRRHELIAKIDAIEASPSLQASLESTPDRSAKQ
jgi:GGDEF domain-containing protein